MARFALRAADKIVLNIVLVEPEIPQNAGNVMRTCACTGAYLHLVEPMGFRLTDKNMKRAGCDYWDHASVTKWPCIDAFLEATEGAQRYLFTGSTQRLYTEVSYPSDVYLLFGRESRGLDEELLERFASQCVRIPMREGMRSLNLSNAVAISAYEVIRQHPLG